MCLHVLGRGVCVFQCGCVLCICWHLFLSRSKVEKTSGSTLTDDWWGPIRVFIWGGVYGSLYLGHTAVDSYNLVCWAPDLLIPSICSRRDSDAAHISLEGHKMSLEMVWGFEASLSVDFNWAQVCACLMYVGACTLFGFVSVECMHLYKCAHAAIFANHWVLSYILTIYSAVICDSYTPHIKN